MSYNGSRNIIPLILTGSRTEEHPKQLGSNAQNYVWVTVTPSYSEGVQKTLFKDLIDTLSSSR